MAGLSLKENFVQCDILSSQFVPLPLYLSWENKDLIINLTVRAKISLVIKVLCRKYARESNSWGERSTI